MHLPYTTVHETLQNFWQTHYTCMKINRKDDVNMQLRVMVVSNYAADRNSENCLANRKISAESARLASGFTVCTFAKHLRIA